MGTAQHVTAQRQEAVINRAREIFLRGERVEMIDLAAYAGVNRNTLFRWFGGRDRILGEVIWSITEPALDSAEEQAAGSGAVRIANVVGDFADKAIRGAAFMPFVHREPELAFRVMTTRAGGVHQRIMERLVGVIDEEVDAGRYVPELPIHDLAYLLLRTAEAFIYSPVISGEEPDAEKVRLAGAALLGVASDFLPAHGSAISDPAGPSVIAH